MGVIKDGVTDGGGSPLRKYQDTIIGSRSLLTLAGFELTQLIAGSVPGALGLALRQVLFPRLFGSWGKGTIIGRNVIIRHPHRIRLDRSVVVDDAACLDGISEADDSIVIGARTMVGTGTKLAAKMGAIRIGENCGFGAGITVHSSVKGSVTFGNNVLIAGHCYIGGGQYHMDRTDIPMVEQGHVENMHLTIGDNAWIGANATIINGITIGRDAIVAAGAVVTKDVPDFALVAGVPAKVLRIREHEAPSDG